MEWKAFVNSNSIIRIVTFDSSIAYLISSDTVVRDIGAVQEVYIVIRISAVVEAANRIQHLARHIILIVTLDVKNAFNTARWVDSLGALESFGVPPYLMRMVEDYFSQRMVLYDMTVGRRSQPL